MKENLKHTNTKRGVNGKKIKNLLIAIAIIVIGTVVMIRMNGWVFYIGGSYTCNKYHHGHNYSDFGGDVYKEKVRRKI